MNHDRFTRAAIDDVIARGNRADWLELRNAVRADDDVKEKVRAVCLAHTQDPSAQRYHFWSHYVQSR